MKIQHNISSFSVTWLANTYDKDKSHGKINNYYQPESLQEFEDLCKEFYTTDTPFKIIGHSSNVYILPDTDIENLVSTRYLKNWHIEDDVCYCECGASVKQIVKEMVANGVEGYACMIDLPGTVGAAIYGNAGVSHDSVANVLLSVKILTSDGKINNYSYEDLKFSRRSSALKRSLIDGVILSCNLRMKKGNLQKIHEEAEYVHQWRLDNQPGHSRNLGTTSLLDMAPMTITGKIVKAIAKACCFFVPKKNRDKTKLYITLSLLNHRNLAPYLFGLNRFMWIDDDAHNRFEEYKALINKMYKNPPLEIEIW